MTVYAAIKYAAIKAEKKEIRFTGGAARRCDAGAGLERAGGMMEGTRGPAGRRRTPETGRFYKTQREVRSIYAVSAKNSGCFGGLPQRLGLPVPLGVGG
ncbi:hypothetical protein [Desulfosarcina widdelii]|uniref:hypothetical protein n=1 Tax=Desulfosarcina widdelii TaxID=947919 RepID=UPI0012D31E09|nr:hypothetical protein [Desulfosarcina widdelii]